MRHGGWWRGEWSGLELGVKNSFPSPSFSFLCPVQFSCVPNEQLTWVARKLNFDSHFLGLVIVVPRLRVLQWGSSSPFIGQSGQRSKTRASDGRL